MQNVADIPTEWAALPYCLVLTINYISYEQGHLSSVSWAVKSVDNTEVEMEIGLIKVGYIIC